MKNNHLHIRELIDKYFDGYTSKEEEKLLHHYFAQGDISPELLPYQTFFVSMGSVSTIPAFSKEDELDFSDDTPTREGYTDHQKMRNTKNFIHMGIILAGVAASLLLLFMLIKPQKPANYVMINGVKFTDKEIVNDALETSFENIKLDMEEILSDFNDLDLDDL